LRAASVATAERPAPWKVAFHEEKSSDSASVLAAQLLALLERRLGRLYLFWIHEMRFNRELHDGPTLASTPTKTDPATSNWKALHLFNGTLCIGFTHELDKATVLSNRHLHLRFIGGLSMKAF